MALNFPHNPSTNDIYTAGGASYKWDGTVWKKAEESGVIDLLPSRVILMYSGTTAPSGFVLCDNSTAAQNANAPDLRDKFIVGSGNSYGLNATGGNVSNTLSSNQVPSHFHYAFRSGNHGQHQNGSPMNANNYPSSGSGRANLYEGYNIGASNDVSNVGKTSDSGASSPSSIENRPPYFALCFIMKL